MKKNFEVTITPKITICFEKSFADNCYRSSIMSFTKNVTIWKSSVHCITNIGNVVYEGQSYPIMALEIPHNTIKVGMHDYLSKIAYTVARDHSTIVFFKYGTFEAVYDFRM